MKITKFKEDITSEIANSFKNSVAIDTEATSQPGFVLKKSYTKALKIASLGSSNLSAHILLPVLLFTNSMLSRNKSPLSRAFPFKRKSAFSVFATSLSEYSLFL